MRTQWKHSHHDANDMFAWFPPTYGVNAARPSGAITRKTQINVHPFALGRDLLPWSKQETASNVSFVQRCKSTEGSATKQNAFRKTQIRNDTSRWRTVILRTRRMPRNRGSQKKTPQQGCRPVSPREIGELLENVCVSSQEPCLPKHNQQINKKHMTQCWRLSSNEPRKKSANEYLRTQTRPNTNAPNAQNAVFHFHRENTNTHENKKNTKRPIENIDKTTNKLYVAAARCQQMKPCTTTSNRRKGQTSARANVLSLTEIGLFLSCSTHHKLPAIQRKP